MTLFILLAAPVLNVMHEMAHLLAGEALGYSMAMSLNKAWPVDQRYESILHHQLVLAAGPLLTAASGFIGLYIALMRKHWVGYALLFMALMHRLMANVFSALGNYNDEAQISIYLDMPWWVVPAIIIAPLLVLTIYTARRLSYGFKPNFVCYVAFSFALTGIFYAENAFFDT